MVSATNRAQSGARPSGDFPTGLGRNRDWLRPCGCQGASAVLGTQVKSCAKGGEMPALVVALHPSFTRLVDWRTLAIPEQEWILVTNAQGAADVDQSQLGRCRMTVTEAFSVDALSPLLERLGCTGRDCRLT